MAENDLNKTNTGMPQAPVITTTTPGQTLGMGKLPQQPVNPNNPGGATGSDSALANIGGLISPEIRQVLDSLKDYAGTTLQPRVKGAPAPMGGKSPSQIDALTHMLASLTSLSERGAANASEERRAGIGITPEMTKIEQSKAGMKGGGTAQTLLQKLMAMGKGIGPQGAAEDTDTGGPKPIPGFTNLVEGGIGINDSFYKRLFK
jgi:hypothetical protein